MAIEANRPGPRRQRALNFDLGPSAKMKSELSIILVRLFHFPQHKFFTGGDTLHSPKSPDLKYPINIFYLTTVSQALRP